MPKPGKLELTIKINEFPTDVKTIEKGWKQFEIDLGSQVITLTLKPEVFQQLEQAQKNYSQWEAAISGQMSSTADKRFLLKDCGVNVYPQSSYPLQTFVSDYLPVTELPQEIEGASCTAPSPPGYREVGWRTQAGGTGTWGHGEIPPSHGVSQSLRLSPASQGTSPALSALPQNATSDGILLRSKTPGGEGQVFMKKLIEGVGEFKANYFSTRQELFEELAHGQKPRVLFITCSDSRIDPNLITQTEMGELFVIRNAGNIIPPFGAANGGEGAAVEYAIHTLGIEQIIICGHSHCGAMKGLLQLGSLQEQMPLVYDWLKHAEATRRLIQENYGHYEGEERLKIAIAENVLTQVENLKTYPVIRSKLNQGKLEIYGWIYRIETGEVLAYDPISHAFVPPQCHLPECHPQDEQTPTQFTSTIAPREVRELPQEQAASNGNGNGVSQDSFSNLWISPKQAKRIYQISNGVN